jgi:hypothetical protein
MSEVKQIGSAQAKVIPLQQKANETPIQNFFSYYGSNTGAIMIGFLDTIYQEFKKSQYWQYSTISEKAIAEFNYQLFRKFLQNLRM